MTTELLTFKVQPPTPQIKVCGIAGMKAPDRVPEVKVAVPSVNESAETVPESTVSVAVRVPLDKEETPSVTTAEVTLVVADSEVTPVTAPAVTVATPSVNVVLWRLFKPVTLLLKSTTAPEVNVDVVIWSDAVSEVKPVITPAVIVATVSENVTD